MSALGFETRGIAIDNPYKAPNTDDTFRDANLHALVRLDYVLSDADIQAGIRRYVAEDPSLMLYTIAAFLVPVMILGFLEEVYGFVPELPFWVVLALLFGGGFSVRYLMGLPIRLRLQRELGKDKLLGTGQKTVTFHAEKVEIVSNESRCEYGLKNVVFRGSAKLHYVVLVLEPRHVLIIPHHAFARSYEFARFVKMIGVRLRSQREFLSLRV